VADDPLGAPVLGVRTSHSLTTDRLRYTSDSDDSDFAARSSDEPFYVVWVACQNRSFLPKGCRHHNGVNDIRRFGHA
jgi:hypothetical protein